MIHRARGVRFRPNQKSSAFESLPIRRGSLSTKVLFLSLDVRVPRNRLCMRFCGDPPPPEVLYSFTILVNCKNSSFCRNKREKRSKIDEIFLNDFDKKVNGSG